MISSNDKLYQKVVNLKEGDVVTFSGNLVNADYGDKVIDMLKSYGAKNKKLYIEFTNIEKVEAK